MALNEGGSVKVADNDFKEILEEIEKTKKGDLFDR
jgi:hypothetical protein